MRATAGGALHCRAFLAGTPRVEYTSGLPPTLIHIPPSPTPTCPPVTAQVRTLLRMVCEQLAPGGALLICEMLLEEDHSGPPSALLQVRAHLVCVGACTKGPLVCRDGPAAACLCGALPLWRMGSQDSSMAGSRHPQDPW